MLNYRRINRKYCLSGGWSDIETDPDFLNDEGIAAVLDLQFTPDDDKGMALFLKDELDVYGIKYYSFPFADSETYTPNQLKHLFKSFDAILTDLENNLLKRQSILVKCGAGVSRSPAALLYHLCKQNDTSYVEELWNMREAEEGLTEFGVSLNVAFHTYLKTTFPDETYNE